MKPEYLPHIKTAAREHLPGYDIRLIMAQIQQESGFNAQAISPAGALGLMQIMPATWKDESTTETDPFNPEHSIRIGCKYMAKMLRGWTAPRPEIDRTCLALASYNAGFGHLLKAQNTPTEPTITPA